MPLCEALEENITISVDYTSHGLSSAAEDVMMCSVTSHIPGQRWSPKLNYRKHAMLLCQG
jgi:hypothetical protein